MTNSIFVPSRRTLAFLLAPLKGIEFNDIDTTSFLKKFVILMDLFIFFEFFSQNAKITRIPLLLTKYLKIEVFVLKRVF